MKDYILTIQELLKGRNEEFDNTPAKRIKLVRHQDTRVTKIILGEKYKESIYNLYRHDSQTFLNYQGEQVKPIYDNIDFLVVLLGEKGLESRFVGIYKNNGLITNDKATGLFYDLVEVSGFEPLKEKAILKWSGRLFHQYYDNDKIVVRIDDGIEAAEGLPIFKSYSDVLLSYDELKKICNLEPREWKQALSSVNCIYMIVDRKNGKQYIGKTADKKEGIWHRWEEYAQTGHGGDKDLKQLLDQDPSYAKNFQWIILEILNLNVTARESDQRETFYKQKFLTREFGYNNN